MFVKFYLVAFFLDIFCFFRQLRWRNSLFYQYFPSFFQFNAYHLTIMRSYIFTLSVLFTLQYKTKFMCNNIRFAKLDSINLGCFLSISIHCRTSWIMRLIYFFVWKRGTFFGVKAWYNTSSKIDKHQAHSHSSAKLNTLSRNK